MKKTISVLFVAILLCSSCFMSGCGLINGCAGKVPTTYPNSEKYTAGDTEFEGTVDTFSLFWIDGSVTVKTHKENTVKIEETSNKDIDDKFRLHWRYYNAQDYGNVLTVYYSASGNFNYGDLKKDITVYLPENDGMDISLTVDTAAVDVDMSGFENTLKELSVTTNSGKVSVKTDSADEVRISGQNDEGIPDENREFLFRANGTVYDLGISSSYARVDVSASSVRSGEVGTVFADLVFSADEAKDIKLRNSRNKIFATVLEFDSIDIETYDAPCELSLSHDASFVLTLKEKDRFNHKMSPKNVSVEFDGATQNGSQYTVGAGEKVVKIATDSDIRILPFVEKN